MLFLRMALVEIDVLNWEDKYAPYPTDQEELPGLFNPLRENIFDFEADI